MYELIQVGPCSYYIDCPCKIGIYVKDNNDAYLIDSGNDKDAGRKVRQILESKGWNLKGILVTHSHADHIGGCKYLQQNTGCKVFAPKTEDAITNNTILEPSMLFGGNPPKDLRNKFLMAQECICGNINDPDFPDEIKVVPLPGHCPNMVGFILPDESFYIADSLSSKTTLEKYQIGYIYDIGQYISSLESLLSSSAKAYIPAHADVLDDISELVEYNLSKVYEIENTILNICKCGCNFDSILQNVFKRYNLTMNIGQHALVGSTVKSYLTYLLENDKIEYYFKDNIMEWKSK